MPATPPPMTKAALVTGKACLCRGSSITTRATTPRIRSLAFSRAFSGSCICTQESWSRMLAISKR